jgi:hypothetical protein
MSQTDVRQLVQPPPTPAGPKDGSVAESLVAGTAGGMPPTAQAFYAVVNADGTLARGFQTATAQNLGTGFYEVIFTVDVTGSAYIATVGNSGTSGIEPTGEATVVGRAGTPNGVFVTTTDSAGNFADRGFHLAVLS